MSTKVTVNQSKSVRVLGLITAIVGVVLFVAGGIAYGMVGSFLKDENITVAGDAAMFPGKAVAGPLTAFAQADVINVHALKNSGGLTYAELGDVQTEAKATLQELTDAGKEAGDAEFDAAQEALDKVTGQRNMVMNGSFLRASLFTSVVSFGVSVLVMGVGVLFTIVGYAIVKISSGPAVVTETTTGAASA